MKLPWPSVRGDRIPCDINATSVHDTLPGEWPQECRKPSKAAVVLFYLSIVFTMLGSIICVRTLFYVHDEEQLYILTLGCSLIILGVVLIVITNCINNHEQKMITEYLKGKIEEAAEDENSRAKRNLREAQILKDSSIVKINENKANLV